MTLLTKTLLLLGVAAAVGAANQGERPAQASQPAPAVDTDAVLPFFARSIPPTDAWAALFNAGRR